LKNKHPKEYNDWLDSFCKNSNVKRVELTKPLGKVKGWSKDRAQKVVISGKVRRLIQEGKNSYEEEA